MRVSRLLLALAAAALALHARPANAQASVDSAGIARTAARFFALELLREITVMRAVSIASPETRFDSLVARELAADGGCAPPESAEQTGPTEDG